MDTNFLANAMMFADSLNQQHEHFMLNVVYPELMNNPGLPNFLSPANLEMYQNPTRWYSKTTQIPIKHYQDDKIPTNSFELIDGKTTETYAIGTVGKFEDSSLVVALALGFPNLEQVGKIRENINAILKENTDKTLCYLAIYGGCSKEVLKGIVRDWKPCEEVSESGGKLYMRTKGDSA